MSKEGSLHACVILCEKTCVTNRPERLQILGKHLQILGNFEDEVGLGSEEPDQPEDVSAH